MASQMLSQTQQSTAASALPGTWKLAAGRAITLEPREAGVVKVAHGQVWATYDGPHSGPSNDLGDHLVGVGSRRAWLSTARPARLALGMAHEGSGKRSDLDG